MEKIVVTVLPEVNQSLFPKLMKVNSDVFIDMAATPLNKKEREYVAGMFATCAAREGVWRPISTIEVGNYLDAGFIFMPLVNGVINEIWEMFNEDLLQVLTLDGKDYLYPTEKLAPMITGRFMSHTKN